MTKIQVNSQGKAYTTSNDKVLNAYVKYNATVNNFLGNVDANGKLLAPVPTDLIFTGVTTIGGTSSDFQMKNAFYYNQGINAVSFPDLIEINGNYSLTNAFQYSSATAGSFGALTTIGNSCIGSFNNLFMYCTNLTTIEFLELTTINCDYGFKYLCSQCSALTTVSFPKLTTIGGTDNFDYAFGSCSALTSLSFPELTTITSIKKIATYCTSLTNLSFPKLETISTISGLDSSFMNCTSLTTVSFPKLTTIATAFNQTFKNCTSLTNIYFYALNAFSNYNTIGPNMLQGVTGCTVHFPSNLQSRIGSWSDVTAGFGGTNTIVLFDLPAIE